MSLYEAYTDEHLLLCIQNGEESAFDELYGRYWRPLYVAASRRLENGQQAEDIVQEIFIRLWSRRHDLNIDNMAAYLHTAVRYRVLSYVTRHKTTAAFYEPFETMLGGSDTPEECLMAKELLELVYAYAETLSDRKKQIFMLHVKGSRSTKEIAETLGITQKSVQNQLGAAMHGLRRTIIPVVTTILALNF
jgi:RNA polymerase sigma-70 factor (ECF subfamily)